MLDRLGREKTATSGRYTFPTPRAAVRTLVEDFYDANGQISMVGRAEDSEDSDFIFKADQRGCYRYSASIPLCLVPSLGTHSV